MAADVRSAPPPSPPRPPSPLASFPFSIFKAFPSPSQNSLPDAYSHSQRQSFTTHTRTHTLSRRSDRGPKLRPSVRPTMRSFLCLFIHPRIILSVRAYVGVEGGPNSKFTSRPNIYLKVHFYFFFMLFCLHKCRRIYHYHNPCNENQYSEVNFPILTFQKKKNSIFIIVNIICNQITKICTLQLKFYWRYLFFLYYNFVS